MTVLDLGCGIDGRSFSDHADPSWTITGVDLNPPERVSHGHPRFTYRQADATDLRDFADRSFDLAVCVGMLEHLTDETAFGRACAEIRRVAAQYLVVVPYRWAWIEPHYGVPFFGALPDRAQRALVSALDLSGHRSVLAKDPQAIRRHTRWRSNREYRSAFPGARIRFLPVMDTIAIVKG
jgi:SAM-dependent methyltransferase